ncbi:PKD domain-containing protein [Sphingobacterium sp.]|uniref:PKD domain-containing protein n=1 Tax=Sphingobacterium sp. TaxID=341027 RepID=UPI0028A7A5A9|nr:PKD domain-containing protein [Sphingobacterium sp.]
MDPEEFDSHYKKTMKRVNNFVLNACFIITCPLFLHSCNNTEGDMEEVKALKANFSFEIDKEAKLSVHFNNESQNYSSLSWDFGDKTGKSSEENSTYTYKTAGIYKVTLTIPNAEGETDKKTIDVNSSSGTSNSRVSGQPVPFGDIGTEWKQIFYDDFTKDGKIGSWGDATDPEKIVYVGKQGQQCRAYPKRYSDTKENNPYRSNSVLYVEDTAMIFHLHRVDAEPAGANPSPVLKDRDQSQLYGPYTTQFKVDKPNLEEYYVAWQLQTESKSKRNGVSGRSIVDWIAQNRYNAS